MAKAIIVSGGGGVSSDDVTASREHVLKGHTAVTNDSGDEPAEGTMPSNPAVSATLNCGEEIEIPAGYCPRGVVRANGLFMQTQGNCFPEDMLEGCSAWVNGEKVIGKLQRNNLYSEIIGTSDVIYDSNSSDYVDFLIPPKAYVDFLEDYGKPTIAIYKYDLAEGLGITEDMIAAGSEVLGISGNTHTFRRIPSSIGEHSITVNKQLKNGVICEVVLPEITQNDNLAFFNVSVYLEDSGGSVDYIDGIMHHVGSNFSGGSGNSLYKWMDDGSNGSSAQIIIERDKLGNKYTISAMTYKDLPYTVTTVEITTMFTSTYSGSMF